MSIENPLWGAPRIHGELLKLGFEVAQSSVAKYMVERRGPPSQGWRTFLQNHAPDIGAMDLFVVPTIGFDLLYAFVIVRLGRRELVWINVTTNPTAEWIARQLTEAFPWNETPRICAKSCEPMLAITMTSERTGHWIKMRPAIAPSSGSGISSHTRSLAGFITTTSGFKFSVHTTAPPPISVMKSRRLIASPRGSGQGIVSIWSRLVKGPLNVRFGSLADIS
jgi:hypothetical protein